METVVTREQAKQTTIGVLLIGLGIVFLGNQFDWGPNWSVRRLWPVILIVMGVPGMLFGDKDGNHGGGLCLAMTGVIFLLHTFSILSLRQSWPLFIVAGGAAMFLDSITCQAPKPDKEASRDQ